jgi:GT2 family glycosyltransferase
MIRTELFRRIGRFDEDFVIYGEETDLSWRIWLAGYKVMQLPQTKAYHAFETGLKPKSYYNNYFIHYHGCKNYITMLLKNLPTWRLYIVAIHTFLWVIVGCAMYFKNRQASKWIFEGIGYVFKNFRYIMEKRRRTQSLKIDMKLTRRSPSLVYYIKRFFEYLTHQLHAQKVSN